MQQSPLRWTLPDDREVLWFDYQIIELAKIPTDELRQKDLKGLLPLLILTQGGATHEVVEEVIDKLLAAKQHELLPITELLSSLVFTSGPDKEWILWRFSQMQNILRETWAYQEIMQEGELLALHQAVLDIVQERFSEIVSFAKKQIDDIQDPEILRRLIVKMSIAQTPEEALQYLFTVDKGEKKN